MDINSFMSSLANAIGSIFTPLGTPFIDITTPLALSSTPAIIYTLTPKLRLRLTEISVFGDSPAVTNGAVQITVKGKIITAPDAGGVISLLSNLQGFTVNLQNSSIILERSDAISISASSSSGSGNLQVMLTGEYIKE